MSDMARPKFREPALEQRDGLLHAITQCAAQLVGATSVNAVLSSALETIGKALRADRVLVIEIIRTEDPVRPAAPVCIWQRPDVPVKVDAKFFLNSIVTTPEIGVWLRPLAEGEVRFAAVDSGTAPIDRLLSAIQTKSILFVPIQVDGKWWGTVTIDDCKLKREWSTAETDALKTFGEIVGVSIVRERSWNQARRTERRLLESEAKFRTAFEQTFQLMGLLATDGTLLDVNRTALEFSGVKAPDVIGKPLWKLPFWLHSPELQGRLRDAVASAANGNLVRFEAAPSAPDGGILYADVSIKPIKDETGKIVSLIAEGRDITGRKHAERALERLNRTLRTLSAANREIVSVTTEEELRNDMCRVGVELGGYRLAWIGLVEQDEAKTVRPVALAGEHPEFIKAANFTWADTELGRGPIGTAIRTGEAQIVQNVETNPVVGPWRAEMLRYDLKASATLPLKQKSEVFGVLVFYAGEPNAFGPEEVDLLKELAADLAFGILARRDHAGREAGLVALDEALKSTVQAIATAIEMRDVYTAGHQQNVARLATAIAREIGLPDQQIEGLFLAAMIHDVGKINVPAELLSKPGKLTPLEYQMIQTHAQSGYEIIKGVKFPWPIAQAILQHHERLDGSGYPNHLKGEAILIEGRIMAVADVVDAMLSHRPYRAGLGVDAALAEIKAGKGRLYDPAIVDACVALFTQKGFSFPQR